MQKRNRLSNSTYHKDNVIKKARKNNSKSKAIARYQKKILKLKFYAEGTIRSLFKNHKIRYRLNIKVCSNNVFFHLTNKLSNKVIVSKNSGSLGVKMSKKTIRYSLIFALTRFLTKFRLKPLHNLCIFISSPANMRKKIIQTLSSCFDTRSTLICLSNKKAYNGCRSPKKLRKKRKRFSLFK